MPKKAEPTGFGRRLKELREAAGLSQEQLAERIGFNKFSVAKLEQGIREPTWTTVRMLAKALGTSCQDFEDGPLKAAIDGPSRGRPPKAVPATPSADDLIETRKHGKNDHGMAPASFEPEVMPAAEGKKKTGKRVKGK